MGNQDIKSTVLWKAQYAPRDKIIKSLLKGEQLRRYNSKPIPKKMIMIDNLERKGFFDDVTEASK